MTDLLFTASNNEYILKVIYPKRYFRIFVENTLVNISLVGASILQKRTHSFYQKKNGIQELMPYFYA